MKRFAPLLLLLAACATTKAPPTPAPDWTRVPRTVLDSFCVQARSEGLARGGTLNVVKTTAPVSAAAIASLAERSQLGLHNAPDVAQQLNMALPRLPIDVPNDVCAWTPVDKLDPARDADMMTVEVTAPFINPFDRREAGLMLRLSLGGQAPLWYWLPIAKRGEQWFAGRVMPLGAQE